MYAREEKFDILGIAETWLYDNIENNKICIEGYTLYRRIQLRLNQVGVGE